MAASGVFSVLVVDLAGMPGQNADGSPLAHLDRWVTPVRRLAIAVEELETTVMLLTDLRAKRSLPLPTAMRLEIERAAEDRLRVTLAKERRGHVAPPRWVTLPWKPLAKVIGAEARREGEAAVVMEVAASRSSTTAA
jgi:hypothetical protein